MTGLLIRWNNISTTKTTTNILLWQCTLTKGTLCWLDSNWSSSRSSKPLKSSVTITQINYKLSPALCLDGIAADITILSLLRNMPLETSTMYLSTVRDRASKILWTSTWFSGPRCWKLGSNYFFSKDLHKVSTIEMVKSPWETYYAQGLCVYGSSRYRTFIKYLLIGSEVLQQDAKAKVIFVDHSMQHGDRQSLAQFEKAIFQQKTCVCDFERTVIHSISFRDVQSLQKALLDTKCIYDIQRLHRQKLEAHGTF